MNLHEKIEIIRRMDLKVAVPQKYQRRSCYFDETITTVETPTIHVPSLIDDLLREIKMAQLQVDDIKRATRVLLDIKREQTNDHTH